MSYSWQYTVGANGIDITSMVTNLTWQYGRQKVTDRWTPYVLDVELIPSPSFTAPQIGQWLELNPNFIDGSALYRGIITDVRRTYDVPRNTTTGVTPGDRVVITANSIYMYTLSSAKANAASILNNPTLDNALNTVMTNAGVTVPLYYGPLTITTPFRTYTAQDETYTGSVLDYANLMTTSCSGYMNEYGYGGVGITSPDSLKLTTYNPSQTNQITFTDADAQNVAAYTLWYDQIEFFSSVDNSYSKVNVTYNNQTGTATAGTAGATYTTNTNLATAANASGTANVLKAQLSQTNPAPFRISTSTAVMRGVGIPLYPRSGWAITVKFRGTTYACIVEGWTISQTAEEARYTFYLSPNIGVPLVLDSTQFGVLNTNILGLG